MTSLAHVQAKLVSAQHCHPNAVQALIGEALAAIDVIATAKEDGAPLLPPYKVRVMDPTGQWSPWVPLGGGLRHSQVEVGLSELDPLAAPALSEQDAGLLEQGASMLEALANDERNRGNDSAAMGAECSAHAVRRLAVELLNAARYRFLARSMGVICIARADENTGGVLKAGAADAAIDAAMVAKGGAA